MGSHWRIFNKIEVVIFVFVHTLFCMTDEFSSASITPIQCHVFNTQIFATIFSNLLIILIILKVNFYLPLFLFKQ